METRSNNWYDRHYKTILIIPAILFFASLFYLFVFYQENGDVIYKDISLTGGTSITVLDESSDGKAIYSTIKASIPDLTIRTISDISTGKQHGFTLESRQDAETLRQAIEEQIGYNLTSENSSTEFSGSSLSQGFYTQLIHAIIVAFLLMGLVVYYIFGTSRKFKLIAGMATAVSVSILFNTVGILNFLSVLGFLICFFWYALTIKGSANRKNEAIKLVVFAVLGIILMNPVILQSILPISIYIIIAVLVASIIAIYTYQSVPSIAIILAALADIVMTIAAVDILGMQISGAGIVAFLMLIGYSVDTDILLTSRLLKSQDGSVNQRIFGAFTTGLTMTLTAIAAVGVSLAIIYSFSETLRQIFQIILIGLLFDLINTWVTNASMLKWYMEVKKIS
ncbi:hypothetical protein FJZ18_04635 [Candidatus Pacearchaeota archaeon]|nr:hypothetical protein [Candidatus Pacearchaeota archaeon]